MLIRGSEMGLHRGGVGTHHEEPQPPGNPTPDLFKWSCLRRLGVSGLKASAGPMENPRAGSLCQFQMQNTSTMAIFEATNI